MAEDLWQRIRWMEQELQEEEPEDGCFPEEAEEEELGPGYNYAVDFDRVMYQDEDYGPPQEEAPPKKGRKPKKRSDIRGLVYLALLELIGIFAIIGWWIRWLI